MLERHNICRYAHMVKTEHTQIANKQVISKDARIQGLMPQTGVSTVTSEFIYSKLHWGVMCSSPIHISG